MSGERQEPDINPSNNINSRLIDAALVVTLTSCSYDTRSSENNALEQPSSNSIATVTPTLTPLITPTENIYKTSTPAANLIIPEAQPTHEIPNNTPTVSPSPIQPTSTPEIESPNYEALSITQKYIPPTPTLAPTKTQKKEPEKPVSPKENETSKFTQKSTGILTNKQILNLPREQRINYIKQRICAYFDKYCSQAIIIAKYESEFDLYARSHADARGIMQIHCPSHINRALVKGDCNRLYDLEINLAVAKEIFEENGDRWAGPWDDTAWHVGQ